MSGEGQIEGEREVCVERRKEEVKQKEEKDSQLTEPDFAQLCEYHTVRLFELAASETENNYTLGTFDHTILEH